MASPPRDGAVARFAAGLRGRRAKLVLTSALFLAGLTLGLRALGMLGSGG